MRLIKTFYLIYKRLKFIDSVYVNGLQEEVFFALLFRPRKSLLKIVSDPVWIRSQTNGQTILDMRNFNLSTLKLKAKVHRFLLNKAINKFDKVISPSIEVIEISKSWKINKVIDFVPNGVKDIILLPKEKKYDLVTVCRLIPLKNCERMIQACKDLGLSLAIVGDGPDEFKLRRLANLLKANVTFLGRLSPDKVLEVLNSSEIYLNLSTTEGMSYSLLEAMICRLPCVVSNIPANTFLIDHQKNGFVVNPSNQLELDAAIKKLIDSKELRYEFGETSYIKVKNNFSELKQFNTMLNLLIGPRLK